MVEVVHVFSRTQLRSPILVAATLVAFAFWRSEWFALAGLPLVYVAWSSCAPNLNLADGCLPTLLTVVALAVGAGTGSPGLLAAGVACGVEWVAASLESAWRCVPAETTDAGAGPKPDPPPARRSDAR